jgi:hypothetical protein
VRSTIIPPTKPGHRAGFSIFLKESPMNWYLTCAYAPDQKRRFHASARARLRKLAVALGFAPGTYDLRNNEAGIAVSGEITLHHERVYIQVSQPSMGYDSGILIRRCEGRRDYTGGRNHFAPLWLLDDIPALAGRVRAVIAADGGSLAA